MYILEHANAQHANATETYVVQLQLHAEIVAESVIVAGRATEVRLYDAEELGIPGVWRKGKLLHVYK